jgi:hypothetical protein
MVRAIKDGIDAKLAPMAGGEMSAYFESLNLKFGRRGDFTKERHDIPDKSFDEIAAEIFELEAATTA